MRRCSLLPVICTALGAIGSVVIYLLIWHSPTIRHFVVFDLEKMADSYHNPLSECPELFLHCLSMQDSSDNRGLWQLDQEFDSKGVHWLVRRAELHRRPEDY